MTEKAKTTAIEAVAETKAQEEVTLDGAVERLARLWEKADAGGDGT